MPRATLDVSFLLFDPIANDWIPSEKNFRVDESASQVRNAIARGSGFLPSLPQKVKDWIHQRQNAVPWKCANCRTSCTLAHDWTSFAVPSQPDTKGTLGTFVMASVPYCSDKPRCKDVAIRLTKEAASEIRGMRTGNEPTVTVPLRVVTMGSTSATPARFVKTKVAIPTDVYTRYTTEEVFGSLVQQPCLEAAQNALGDGTPPCASCGGEAANFSYRIIIPSAVGRFPTPKDEVHFEVFPKCLNPSCIKKTRKVVSGGKGASCQRCMTTSLDIKREFQRCSKCKAVTYCSRRCQEDDWPEHRQYCSGKAQVEVEGEVVTEPNATTAESSACGACGREEEEGDKLLLCSGCHSVKYCDRECQRAAWKTHKATCKASG